MGFFDFLQKITPGGGNPLKMLNPATAGFGGGSLPGANRLPNPFGGGNGAAMSGMGGYGRPEQMMGGGQMGQMASGMPGSQMGGMRERAMQAAQGGIRGGMGGGQMQQGAPNPMMVQLGNQLAKGGGMQGGGALAQGMMNRPGMQDPRNRRARMF